MVSAALAAFSALFAAFTAIELFPFLLELPSRSDTSTSFDTAVQVLLTLALFAAVTVIHLHHAAAAVGAGNNRRRLPELVPFVLFTAAGILEYFLFVLPAGGENCGGALRRASVNALPASAAVVFFLGITLVIAHIRAGGEGGGSGAVAGNRLVPVPVDLLKKIAVGAAAALLVQIAIAL